MENREYLKMYEEERDQKIRKIYIFFCIAGFVIGLLPFFIMGLFTYYQLNYNTAFTFEKFREDLSSMVLSFMIMEIIGGVILSRIRLICVENVFKRDSEKERAEFYNKLGL